MKVSKGFYTALLIIYVFILFVMLYFFGNVSNMNNSSFFNKIMSLVNIIPFMNLGNFQSIIISIIRFMPLALILPNIFNQLKKPYRFYITIILIITFYEIAKVLLLMGYADINDVIFGSISTIIVYQILFKVGFNGKL